MPSGPLLAPWRLRYSIKKLEQGHGFHPRLETMVRLAGGLEVPLLELVRCIDPALSREDRESAGSVNVWLAGLDEPSRALVLALVRVLAKTQEAERVVAPVGG